MPSRYYQPISISDKQRLQRRRIIEVSICLCLLVLGAVLFFFGKNIIFSFVFSLKPGKRGFITWLNPPITTTRNYYLFNVTNPDKFLSKPEKTKLHVADAGPYTYDVKTNRKNITWYNDNEHMSYEIERIFVRDPNGFNSSSVDDRGNFVNMVRSLIRTKFEGIPSHAFEAAIDDEPPFRKDPIELLEGYVSKGSRRVQDQMKGPNTDKYGLVYRQNGSRLYNMTIKTNLFEKGQMLKFASELSSFNILTPSHYSFPVYDGLTFPVMLMNQPKIDVFNSDFCRPIRIEYNGTVSKFGIEKIHKYVLKLIDFNNCANPNDSSTCPEVDRLDVSSCLSDTLEKDTIFLTKAHFYGSSNETIDEMNIQGFQPSADKHDSVIYFEPYTGTPIQATYRIQMNIEAIIDPMTMSDDGTFTRTHKRSVKRTLPVFWIEQTVQVSQETISKIQKVQSIFKKLSSWIIFPIFIGLCITFVIMIELCARRFNC